MITEMTDKGAGKGRAWIGWVPLVLLPVGAILLKAHLPSWAFMWLLAFSIFSGLKWMTWWESAEARHHSTRARSFAYLTLWPGMEADQFLNTKADVAKPTLAQWSFALSKTLLGVILIWGIVRLIPDTQPLLIGWTGMLGLIMLLHFGSFHTIALLWQRMGMDAQPIMNNPLRSTSLSEFWGKRWNLGFRQLSHKYLFSPLRRVVGTASAMFVVFLASGVLHDLVISLPAGAGYGLPTAYFALQGFGIALERSALGKRARLGKGLKGWLYMLLFTAGPAIILFHPPFVERVMIPFLEAIGAR